MICKKNTTFLCQSALQTFCMATGCDVIMYLVYISHVHDYWDNTRVPYKKSFCLKRQLLRMGKKDFPHAKNRDDRQEKNFAFWRTYVSSSSILDWSYVFRFFIFANPMQIRFFAWLLFEGKNSIFNVTSPNPYVLTETCKVAGKREKYRKKEM